MYIAGAYPGGLWGLGPRVTKGVPTEKKKERKGKKRGGKEGNKS